MSRIVRDEGWFGLFKGNMLNVARIAPTKAVEFFVYDSFKAFQLVAVKNPDGTKRKDLSGGERMFGGSVASMAGTALSHPVDTLRSRVTVQAISAGATQMLKKTDTPHIGVYHSINKTDIRSIQGTACAR